MFDVAVVGGLAVYVAFVARRALRGAPPRAPIRFAVIAGVSAAIHLGFHAAATAAPSLPSVVALVLSGWTSFVLWLAWLSRSPAARDKPDDDASGGGGGGGGRGPDGPPGDGPTGGDDGLVDWEQFEREFTDYVAERERGEPALD